MQSKNRLRNQGDQTDVLDVVRAHTRVLLALLTGVVGGAQDAAVAVLSTEVRCNAMWSGRKPQSQSRLRGMVRGRDAVGGAEGFTGRDCARLARAGLDARAAGGRASAPPLFLHGGWSRGRWTSWRALPLPPSCRVPTSELVCEVLVSRQPRACRESMRNLLGRIDAEGEVRNALARVCSG